MLPTHEPDIPPPTKGRIGDGNEEVPENKKACCGGCCQAKLDPYVKLKVGYVVLFSLMSVANAARQTRQAPPTTTYLCPAEALWTGSHDVGCGGWWK